MADAGILAPTIMGLFQKLAIITSTLHPPTHWADYNLAECVVLDKNIPEESAFFDAQFIENDQPVRVFNAKAEIPPGIVDIMQGPMASILRNAFEEKIQNFEQAVRQNLFQTYQRSVTPVDHASIVMVYNLVTNFWSWLEPKIHMHLQNSRFFGHIDNFRYKEAVDFSGFHANEALYKAIAFRHAALNGRQYIVDKDRIDLFKDQFTLNYQQFRPWYQRFLLTRQFSDVLHYLYELYGYHDAMLQSARKKMDGFKESTKSVPPKLAENAFFHAVKVADYHREIVEITASHHNALMITRHPSWINWGLEKTIDYAGGLLLNTQQPRDLGELCEHAHTVYEELCHAEIQAPKEPITFQEKIQKYKDYIEGDYFARVYRLFEETTVSGVDEPSIDWKRQHRYFENYRRLTDCTIYTLSLMEEAIPALMATIAALFDYSVLNNKTKKQTDKLCDLLGNIHQHIQYLQDHRYILKLSFLKFMQTSVNKETSDYFDRAQIAVLNTFKGMIVTGNIFENVGNFTDQQQACVEGINHVYTFLHRAKEQLGEFNVSDPVVADYIAILPDQSPTTIPIFMILPLKDRAFTRSIKTLTSAEGQEITADRIKALKIQCKQKIESAKEENDDDVAYWKSQHTTLNQFEKIFGKITQQKKRIVTYQEALKKDNFLKKDDFDARLIKISGKLNKIETDLKASLRKQTLTEKNEHEGWSWSRIINSGARKLDRFCKTGDIIDQRVPLNQAADGYLAQCADLESSLDTLRDQINAEICHLKEIKDRLALKKGAALKKGTAMTSQSTPTLHKKKSVTSSPATGTRKASSQRSTANTVQKAPAKPAVRKDDTSKESVVKKTATPQKTPVVAESKKTTVVKKDAVENDDESDSDDADLSENESESSADADGESDDALDSEDEE